MAYYHRFRTHLSLAMDCPESRPVEPPEAGDVIGVPEVGGLHHHMNGEWRECSGTHPFAFPMLWVFGNHSHTNRVVGDHPLLVAFVHL